MEIMATAAPGNNWTNTSMFRCQNTSTYPLHGTEILIIGIVYVALISVYSVTFMEVALKQMWPSKFLNEKVWTRIQKLRSDFPGIGGGSGSLAADDDTSIIQYDAVVSQEPYIASCCVDEDLTFILANDSAFATVSSYCTCTVRGNTLLPTFLMMTGVCLGFLWIHNAYIYPVSPETSSRYLGILGYCIIFCTGIVMCSPLDSDGKAVYRNRNILLWDSINVNSTSGSKILKLHMIGFMSFMFLPLMSTQIQIWTLPADHIVNYNGKVLGLKCQFVTLIGFALPYLLGKAGKIPDTLRRKLSIITEILAMTASLLAFVQNETYSAAACAQCPTTYALAVIGTMFAVIGVFVTKQAAGAPVGPYANGPSVLLLNSGQPVATSGAPPILDYNRQTAFLPTISPPGKTG